MRLEREPKVILVLPEHIDQLFIVAAQSTRYLLESLLHLTNVSLQIAYERVVCFISISEIFLDIVYKRFKN